jgi:hypothetical protein
MASEPTYTELSAAEVGWLARVVQHAGTSESIVAVKARSANSSAFS